MLIASVLHLVLLKQLTSASADLIKQVAASGRCITLAESPDDKTNNRIRIAPGQPPLLTFRYYQGKLHHRFGNGELMLDDAGH